MQCENPHHHHSLATIHVPKTALSPAHTPVHGLAAGDILSPGSPLSSQLGEKEHKQEAKETKLSRAGL